MTTEKFKITLLGSTRGTILPALVSSLDSVNIEITEIISNKPTAGILQKAAQLQLPYRCINSNESDYEITLNQRLHQIDTQLIVLLGFMKILSSDFIQRWPQKIINVHPSLLPRHKGLMDLNVHQSVLDHAETETGCTVHWVTEEVDAGGVLLQKTCPVCSGDTAEILKQRVQNIEAAALSEAIIALAKGEHCVGAI